MIFNDIFILLYILTFIFTILCYVYLVNKKFNKLMIEIKDGNFHNYIYYESDEYIHTDSD